MFVLSFLGLIFYWLPSFGKKICVGCLCFLAFDVFRFRRYSLLRNLHIAFPTKPHLELKEIARQSVWTTIFNFLEVCSIRWWKTFGLPPYQILGRENYEKLQGHGVLGLSLHLGNGDAGCALLAASGLPVVLISKKFKSRALNKFWFGTRESMGTRFIDPHNPKNAFEILSALKSKSIVIFVMDQFMGKPYGIETEFFGRKTGTSQGLALFQIKTKLPVVPLFSYKDAALNNVIEFGAPISISESETELAHGREQDIQIQTDRYNKILEALIKSRPGQWMWIHRRWKKWE